MVRGAGVVVVCFFKYDMTILTASGLLIKADTSFSSTWGGWYTCRFVLSSFKKRGKILIFEVIEVHIIEFVPYLGHHQRGHQPPANQATENGKRVKLHDFTSFTFSLEKLDERSPLSTHTEPSLCLDHTRGFSCDLYDSHTVNHFLRTFHTGLKKSQNFGK